MKILLKLMFFPLTLVKVLVYDIPVRKRCSK